MNKVESPEIWSRICGFSSGKDLSSIILTSSAILQHIRPILYESVHLRSDRKTLPTFALLKRNIALAGHIKSITLETVAVGDVKKERKTSWVDIRTFAGMAQLRTLSMTSGPPFKTEAEQKKFLNLIDKSCKLLREVVYHDGYGPASSFPGERFEVKRLTKIIWDESGEPLPPESAPSTF